jgi:hypothetical protein
VTWDRYVVAADPQAQSVPLGNTSLSVGAVQRSQLATLDTAGP